jgi:hypothetical protein
MSEYQYYEFRALDHPLTQAQMRELRTYSGRAEITPTSFVNVYNWGSFKGDEDQWMEKYFDAFLYVANWGTHRLEFRIPKRLLDPKTASIYCAEEGLSSRVKGDYVILSFDSEDEDGEWAEGEGWMASLMPLRADLMNGDHRSLYLGWLGAARAGQLNDDDIEPPVPPGLGSLSAPLRSLADFLRVDLDLISSAAEAGPSEQVAAMTHEEILAWIAAMAPKDKDAVIAALIEGKDPHYAAEFRQRVVRDIQHARNCGGNVPAGKRRSVGQLLKRAESLAGERRAKEAEIHAREMAKREHKQAEQRRKYIEALVGKEASLWSKVDKLIATKNPNRYNDAVSLIQDLRDLAAMTNQMAAFTSRMESVCGEHARKPAFLERLRKAGLVG